MSSVEKYWIFSFWNNNIFWNSVDLQMTHFCARTEEVISTSIQLCLPYSIENKKLIKQANLNKNCRASTIGKIVSDSVCEVSPIVGA